MPGPASISDISHSDPANRRNFAKRSPDHCRLIKSRVINRDRSAPGSYVRVVLCADCLPEFTVVRLYIDCLIVRDKYNPLRYSQLVAVTIVSGIDVVVCRRAGNNLKPETKQDRADTFSTASLVGRA